MGKRGPCYHCGVTSTPLWRNGPPDKPVLCNACGSRWRTKGTLVNYTPLHARAEPGDFEDYRVSKVRTISIKNRDVKVFKRKYDNECTEFGGVPLNYNHEFHKGFDEDTSNRSSSGSAISNLESCAQYGMADASELTGPSQPIVWDTMVPSWKRTCITRPKSISPVEKLTKDLYTIWHEQQSSCLSGSSEEELLLESDKPMVSVEIGHGSVLIQHPSLARQEESLASSLSIDNKQCTVNSRRMTFPGLVEDTGVNSSSQGINKINKPANQGMDREQFGRDRDQLEKLLILAHHNSPLRDIGLQDVLNSDKFSSHLTNDEQQQLLKLLPSIDTLEGPDSLKSMFDSPQFKENLLSVQKLLADGVFDMSLSGVQTEDCRTLKKFVLCILAKLKSVEQCKILKDSKGENNINRSEDKGGSNAVINDYSESVKRSRDGQHQKFSGENAIIKSPQRIMMKSSYDQKEVIDKDGLFSSPKNLFSSQNDVLDSFHFADDNSEKDLVLDLPSNASFPLAEFLPTSSFHAQASTSSSSVYPNLIQP